MNGMRKKRRFPIKKRELPLHIMMLPIVVYLLIFNYYPMYGMVMAFQRFSPVRGFLHSEWVGLDNFRFIFSMPNLWPVVRNTITISGSKVILGVATAVIFALLLNEMRALKYKRFVQVLACLPNYISWVIFAHIFIDLLSPSSGYINRMLGAIGIEPIYFLSDNFWFPVTMIITDVWKGFGFSAIIYLAALTSIDPHLYDAAYIDGANRLKQTWYITLPGIAPIVTLITCISIGGILSANFDQIYNLYNPSVYATGDVLDTMIYRMGIENTLYSFAAAVNMFRSMVSLLLMGTFAFIAFKVIKIKIF